MPDKIDQSQSWDLKNELTNELTVAYNLSWNDVQIIINTVSEFYPVSTYQNFRLKVWQFCQRIENS